MLNNIKNNTLPIILVILIITTSTSMVDAVIFEDQSLQLITDTKDVTVAIRANGYNGSLIFQNGNDAFNIMLENGTNTLVISEGTGYTPLMEFYSNGTIMVPGEIMLNGNADGIEQRVTHVEDWHHALQEAIEELLSIISDDENVIFGGLVDYLEDHETRITTGEDLHDTIETAIDNFMISHLSSTGITFGSLFTVLGAYLDGIDSRIITVENSPALSYVSENDICGDMKDNNLNGFIDEYVGDFLPFTNFGNCMLDSNNHNLDTVDIHGSIFNGSDLSNTSFRFSNLTDTKFLNISTSFGLLSLSGSDITNIKFNNSTIAMLANFVNSTNADFSNNIFVDYIPTYRSSTFNSAILINANFSNSDLTNSIFVNSNLDGVDFTNSILTGANLNNTSIVGTIFTGCTGHPFCS